jgi:hypothetical protein
VTGVVRRDAELGHGAEAGDGIGEGFLGAGAKLGAGGGVTGSEAGEGVDGVGGGDHAGEGRVCSSGRSGILGAEEGGDTLLDLGIGVVEAQGGEGCEGEGGGGGIDVGVVGFEGPGKAVGGGAGVELPHAVGALELAEAAEVGERLGFEAGGEVLVAGDEDIGGE